MTSENFSNLKNKFTEFNNTKSDLDHYLSIVESDLSGLLNCNINQIKVDLDTHIIMIDLRKNIKWYIDSERISVLKDYLGSDKIKLYSENREYLTLYY